MKSRNVTPSTGKGRSKRSPLIKQPEIKGRRESRHPIRPIRDGERIIHRYRKAAGAEQGIGNGKGKGEQKREKKARSGNGERNKTRAKDNILPAVLAFFLIGISQNVPAPSYQGRLQTLYGLQGLINRKSRENGRRKLTRKQRGKKRAGTVAASAASHPPGNSRYCKHESRGRVIDPVYCLRENEKIGLVVLEYADKK